MITVLIPTAKRPDLLANALRSVAEQTALSEVSRIVVSESAGDRRSEEVCRQFSQLPIEYLFRDPPLPMTPHFSALKMAKWPDEFAAILHDDDWWAPEHLSVAMASFRERPQSVAYCSNSYFVPGERSLLRCSWTLAFWFGLNYPALRGIWELGIREAMLGLLIEMPTTYSTMVIRAEVLPEAAIVYDSGNDWDADRMLLCELAAHGPLLYCPFPHAFYREHPQQATHALASKYREQQMVATTEWMIHRSGETWESAGRLFSERFSECPPEAIGSLRHCALKPWCLPLLAAHADPEAAISRLYRQSLTGGQSRAGKVAQHLLPPFVFDYLRSLHQARRQKS